MTRPKKPTPVIYELRTYQALAIERAREHFRQGKRAVLLVAPTGSGKTVIGAEIARLHFNREGQVVWLAHRIELVKQAVEKLRAAGIPDVGAIAAEQSFNERAKVVVCSIQTLLARPKLRPDASLIIADEAHHYVSPDWSALMMYYKQALTVGLTATPQRSDGTALGDIFDAMVVVTTPAELVAAGHLAPIMVVAPGRRLETGALVDPVSALRRFAPHRKAVVFASNVEHARQIANELQTWYIDGHTPADQRAAILDAFDRSIAGVLVNVYVLTEGWDCPSVEVCVLASNCSSPAAFIQRVGRVRRTHPGKLTSLLIDCKGSVYEHGLPDEPRFFSLTGRPIERKKGLPAIRQCPQCGSVFRVLAVCPRCAYVFPPPRVPFEVKRKMAYVDNVTPEVTKRAYLRELLGKARTLNHKPGWAAHRFKWRWGHWPPDSWMREDASIQGK